MDRSRFSSEQIAYALRQADTGTPAPWRRPQPVPRVPGRLLPVDALLGLVEIAVIDVLVHPAIDIAAE